MHDAAWSLLSQASGLGELAPWAQLVATGVITILFVWIVMKRDPVERERNLKELAKEREINREELASARADYRESLQLVLAELAAERASREAAAEKFATMITENRERSHTQRMEDRKVYQESTRAMLQEFLAAIKEIRNGNSSA